MRKLPVVAIVGRPNVGKSSYFNAVLGRRVAIVDPMAGVTRDRISEEVAYRDRSFELIDTGGIGLFDEALLKSEIENQIAIALDLADAIIFLVDARDGRTPMDEEVAGRLRACGKPVVLVVNKIDSKALESEKHGFHSLGFGEPQAASAVEGRGVFAALGRALDLIPPDPVCPEENNEGPGEDLIKVAVVGKMNAGKSTLVNHLARENRVIVSDVPGTTRDSVDVAFRVGGRKFVVIDTAGIRRKKAIQDSVEFYGQARAERAIRRADVVVLLIDATTEISLVDKKIADLVITSYKPCVLAVSKWDLAEGHTPDEYGTYVGDRLPGFGFFPLTFISSKTGFNVENTFDLVAELHRQATLRMPTGEVNRVLESAIARRAPQIRKSRLAKIYFGIQVEVGPPTFVIFVNDIRLFNRDYRRYLSNRFREAFPFREVPIKIAFRGKDRAGRGGRRGER